MRGRAAALALSAALGVTVLGCSGGSGGSSPLPPPSTSSTTPAPGAPVADGALDEDEIAGIEKALDEIDLLLDDLDAELRAD